MGFKLSVEAQKDLTLNLRIEQTDGPSPTNQNNRYNPIAIFIFGFLIFRQTFVQIFTIWVSFCVILP